MQTFRMKKWLRILAYIIVPLLMFTFASIPFILYSESKSTLGLVFFGIICLGLTVLMIFALLDAKNRKVILEENRITKVGAWKTKTFTIDQIKGYKLASQASTSHLFIHANDGSGKIQIDNYTEGFKEIVSWTRSKCPDLQVLEKMEAEKEILANSVFGADEATIVEKLKRNKKIAKGVSIAGIGVGAWLFLFPFPYFWAILIGVLVPIATLLIGLFLSGPMRMLNEQSGAYPILIFGILGPAVGLFLRALIDYTIIDHNNLWLPMLAVVAVFYIITILKFDEFKISKIKDILSHLIFVLSISAFSFGLIISYNGLAGEKEVPAIYRAKVLDKSKSSGKYSDTFSLRLSAWENQAENEKLEVQEALYMNSEIGDSINILVYNGGLNIPYVLTFR